MTDLGLEEGAVEPVVRVVVEVIIGHAGGVVVDQGAMHGSQSKSSGFGQDLAIRPCHGYRIPSSGDVGKTYTFYLSCLHSLITSLCTTLLQIQDLLAQAVEPWMTSVAHARPIHNHPLLESGVILSCKM